jgi:hypothetical protein
MTLMLKSSECHPEQFHPSAGGSLELNPLDFFHARVRYRHLPVVLPQQPIPNQQRSADQQRIPRKGRRGLVRGPTIADGTGGKNLPPALVTGTEKTNEFIGRRAGIPGTDIAERPWTIGPWKAINMRARGESGWQRRDMQKQPARAAKQ